LCFKNKDANMQLKGTLSTHYGVIIIIIKNLSQLPKMKDLIMH